eukprot:5339523-Ditylum_brightwellii.AAC.1
MDHTLNSFLHGNRTHVHCLGKTLANQLSQFLSMEAPDVTEENGTNGSPHFIFINGNLMTMDAAIPIGKPVDISSIAP